VGGAEFEFEFVRGLGVGGVVVGGIDLGSGTVRHVNGSAVGVVGVFDNPVLEGEASF
jgi:hypothetical protein